MKESLFSGERIRALYDHLADEYRRMVEEDPTNCVFGPPDDYFRVLEPKEYEHHVNMDKVAFAVETAEHLLSWDKFERHVLRLIEQHDAITVEEHSEVIAASQTPSAPERYALTVRRADGTVRTVRTCHVVNCTWSDIERVNALVGFQEVPQLRTNRLKVLLEVSLPPSLVDAPSMFFCMGPFCMFSNLGGGRALMTYAPESNVDMCTAVCLKPSIARLLYEGPTDAEYQFHSGRILQGVSSFIPQLSHAKIVGLRFGIVQTHGTVNLHDVESPFHGRAYFGVRQEAAGWVSNPCMKLLYMLENAVIVTDLLEAPAEGRAI